LRFELCTKIECPRGENRHQLDAVQIRCHAAEVSAQNRLPNSGESVERMSARHLGFPGFRDRSTVTRLTLIGNVTS
jgi:hypothetical protein